MALTNTFRFLSVLFTAVSMAAAFAHLFELPNKINLPREDYLTVQQIYRGWALLGVVVVGALLSTLVLTVMVRDNSKMFHLTLTATICIALSLVVFFMFTYPANQHTLNWTMLPENWEELRRQWEYSHATGAGLYFVALIALTLSLLVERT
jgi:exosortase/archaeosortase